MIFSYFFSISKLDNLSGTEGVNGNINSVKSKTNDAVISAVNKHTDSPAVFQLRIQMASR